MPQNAYLLNLPHNNKSGRMLATKLGLEHTSVVRDYAPTIRYGNARGVFDDDTKFNSPIAIRLCGNSVDFSIWGETNNINTPKYTPFSDVPQPYNFPFLLRRKHHRGGLDIIVVNSEDDIKNVPNLSSYYHVPLLQSDLELGIHIVGNKVARIFKKIKIDDTSHPFIRSSNFGYHYSLVSDLSKNFVAAQRICLDLFSKLDLGFGRVDMGYNETTKRYIVFEVNTAPGLNVNSSEVYATILRELLNV